MSNEIPWWVVVTQGGRTSGHLVQAADRDGAILEALKQREKTDDPSVLRSVRRRSRIASVNRLSGESQE